MVYVLMCPDLLEFNLSKHEGEQQNSLLTDNEKEVTKDMRERR